MILAGVDEAGLGPTLGPLATAAAALSVPESWNHATAWEALSPAITEKPSRRDPRLVVADSKIVHAAGGAFALELAIAALCACLFECTNPPSLSYSGFSNGKLPKDVYPWHSGSLAPFPCFCERANITEAWNAVSKVMKDVGAAMAALDVSALHPSEMNRLYAAGLNKNEILLGETGARLTALVTRFADQGLWVMVDKQGGRNDYCLF